MVQSPPWPAASSLAKTATPTVQKFQQSSPDPNSLIKMLASTARPLLSSVARTAGCRHASTIAPKYSQALYNAALAKSPATLTKVQTELGAIASSLKSNAQLGAFVENPLLSAKERSSGLEALFAAATGAGPKSGAKAAEPVSEVTRNLFVVLSENGRLAEAPAVIEGFNELVAKYKGELEIVVTSAAPLPKEALTKLESTLKQSESAKQAKVLKVTNKVC